MLHRTEVSFCHFRVTVRVSRVMVLFCSVP